MSSGITELSALDGIEALQALGAVVEKNTSVSIEGFVIASIRSLEHRQGHQRDIVVTAETIGKQALLLLFGSNDTPVIDYQMQIFGNEQ